MESTQLLPTSNPAPNGDGGRRRTAWYVGLTFAVVVVLGLIFYVATQVFGGGGTKVRVPDLSGQTQEIATATLAQKGLVLGAVNPQESDSPKGTVIGQNPLPNTEVDQNTAVAITISAGPKQVPVPTLVGLTQSEAINALTQNGLTLGKLGTKASDLPAGTVLSSDPKEGQLVDQGSPVDLVVSSGKIKVPKVVGLSEAQAKADLTNLGFVVVSIPQEDGSVEPGTVLAQNPPEGSLLSVGKTVTITVATAPPPPPSSPAASPSVSPSDA